MTTRTESDASRVEEPATRVTVREAYRAPLNPPGSDWYPRLYRRFREALRAAREDACTRCGAAGQHMRHYGWPSECLGDPGR